MLTAEEMKTYHTPDGKRSLIIRGQVATCAGQPVAEIVYQHNGMTLIQFPAEDWVDNLVIHDVLFPPTLLGLVIFVEKYTRGIELNTHDFDKDSYSVDDTHTIYLSKQWASLEEQTDNDVVALTITYDHDLKQYVVDYITVL